MTHHFIFLTEPKPNLGRVRVVLGPGSKLTPLHNLDWKSLGDLERKFGSIECVEIVNDCLKAFWGKV